MRTCLQCAGDRIRTDGRNEVFAVVVGRLAAGSLLRGRRRSALRALGRSPEDGAEAGLGRAVAPRSLAPMAGAVELAADAAAREAREAYRRASARRAQQGLARCREPGPGGGAGSAGTVRRVRDRSGEGPGRRGGQCAGRHHMARGGCRGWSSASPGVPPVAGRGPFSEQLRTGAVISPRSTGSRLRTARAGPADSAEARSGAAVRGPAELWPPRSGASGVAPARTVSSRRAGPG